MSSVVRDLRFALRFLRRSPLFTAIATLALGLGIAASMAIFSLMDAILLRPTPGVEAPAEIVSFERWQAGQLLGDMGYPDYLDYRKQLLSFSGLVAEAGTPLSFAKGALVERISGRLVSGNYFSVLGIRPAVGRLLEDLDDREGQSEPVAVLSYPFWRRAFGGEPGIVGSAILLNGHTFTIVGVVQSDFRGTQPQSQTDLWLPITLQPVAMPRLAPDTLQSRASGWLRIFGRLKAGVTLAAAQAEVSTGAAHLALSYPLTNHTRTVRLVPGLGLWSDDRAELQRFLSLLLLCVGLLQLIACANVANLLLARGVARRREIAVRLALGASRGALLRLLLMEGVLLASLAGAIGIVLGPAMAKLATSVEQPAYAVRGADVHLDLRVMIFALLFTLLSGLLFAATPAWQGARLDLVTYLKDGLPGVGRAKSRLRGVLIAAQIALCLALLAAAGTVLETMRRALAANPIARPEQILLCRFDLTIQGYTPEQGQRFNQALLQRIRALPGVASASLAFTVPPEEWGSRRSIFYPGQEPPPEVFQGREFELGIWVDTDTVSSGFFQTLGIPILEGRDFSEQDRPDSPLVAIVNERLAQRLWPGKNPMGQRIAVPEWGGLPRPPVEVVGVAKDVPSRSLLGEAALQIYLPFSQEYDGRPALVVRGSVPPARLLSGLPDVVRQLDPRLPLYSLQTMPEHIDASLWRQRVAAGLLSIFGLLAVVLAAMGLYGVVAHSVAQRTREIGIRIAIGAQRSQISALVIREGMTWVLAGAIVGFPAAMLGTLAMQKGIPGAKPNDPLTLGAALLVLGAVALLASYIPARRAARVDPIVALRYE